VNFIYSLETGSVRIWIELRIESTC